MFFGFELNEMQKVCYFKFERYYSCFISKVFIQLKNF